MITPKIIVYSVLGILTLFGLVYLYYHIKVESNIDDGKDPCPLTDTVDLTGYQKFANDSYLYEDLIIPSHLWKVYEYKPDKFSKWIPSKPHARGCVCQLRPCVKLCCSKRKRVTQNYKCVNFNGIKTLYNEITVTTSKGETRQADIFKEFSIQYGLTSPSMYYLNPDIYPDSDSFNFFENGTLLFTNTKTYVSKEHFCLSYRDYKNGTYKLTPMNASSSVPSETRTNVSTITMLFSVPFFILTIFVYMAIPELRTLHGKALCCYLSGLTFGYLVVSAAAMVPSSYFTNISCKIMGFYGYFSFMFAFCWLSVISFDLYYKISGIRRGYNEKQRFICYCIYAWSLALILLGLTYAADVSSFIPDPWKPSINVKNHCWFSGVDGWAAMIYMYIPVLTFSAFSIVMFILTSRLIYGIQKEMRQMTNHKDSERNLRSDRDKFGIFLRLFIVMGVTWSVDIIPYLIGTTDSWIALQYFFDFVMGIQGFVIFVLFVLKKKVKKQIIERFLANSTKEPHSQDSIKTQSSSNNITLNDIAVHKPAADKLIPDQN